MNRRHFSIGMIGGLAGLALWGFGKRYGRINVREHGGRWRVWLNGQEVSALCFEADDISGYVRLYRRRGGRFYFERETGGMAQETLFGKVRIERA